MEKKKWQKLKILFIAAFFACSLVPLVFLPWFGNQEAESKDADVALTPLISEGKLNPQFFTDPSGKFNGKFAEEAGDWFSKKFAFRREMVDAGDLIKAKVFGTSGQSGVMTGRKGYLFYTDSFDNFLGRDQLTDYELSALTYNVKLMQDTLKEHGIDFLFTIAPNKNTLYPDLMPERYDPDVDNRNISRLTPLIEESGINYAGLYELFSRKSSGGRVMYHRGDSHWTNEGARMVTAKLMSVLGRSHERHGEEKKGGKTVKRKDFKGDLYKMLYPARDVFDPEYYDSDMEPEAFSERMLVEVPDQSNMGMLGETDITKNRTWSEEAEIETVHLEDRRGTLLMIRDSFGNSLTPYVADEFREATFLNGDPYDLGRALVDEKDTVIFEIVERNLDRLLKDAAVIGATDDLSAAEEKKLSGMIKNVSPEKNGGGDKVRAELPMEYPGYIHVTGSLDPEKAEKSSGVYLIFTEKKTGRSKVFKAYRTLRSGDEGSGAEEAPQEDDPEKPYGVSSYISEEDVSSGAHTISVAYKEGSKWHVESAGTFDHEE